MAEFCPLCTDQSVQGGLMYKILIVEDDLPMAQAIQKEMKMWGNEAEYVQDFQNVLTTFTAYDPHLVLMDITLPFYNGYHWCGEIRAVSKVPIVFLSSADDNMNIVMALNMGGDDFITKPFDLNVLTAKIQALLRRNYSFQEPSAALEYQGAVLNLSDATLTYEGKRVELTKNEYRILQCLMSRVGEIVSRDAIMKALWEDDSFVDDNTLTVNVTRLRRKLSDAGLSDFIRTKKGIGYMVGA